MSTALFGSILGGVGLAITLGTMVWKLSAKLKDLEKKSAGAPLSQKSNGITPHQQLMSNLNALNISATKTHELVRDHVSTIAATGERQIEILQELIGIVKSLQKDVLEMKIRAELEGEK